MKVNACYSTRAAYLTPLLIVGLVLMPMLSPAAQVESSVECNEGAEPVDLTYGDQTTNCAIDPATDLDRFEFCGTAGDEVRLNVLSASNYMDPNIIVRGPTAIIISQASCNDSCSLTIDTVLPATGCYTIFMSDLGTNETGTYTLQLEKIIPVPAAAVQLEYDAPVNDTIDQGTDIDFFTFNATAGTDIRFNVLAASNYMDPTIEIRDPNGTVIVDGVSDGATCNDSCSFSLDLSPALSGTYSLLIYDRTTNEIGGYELSLWCLAGQCDGAPDPSGPEISYVTPISNVISPAVDGDFFTFNATAGTDVRVNVLAASNYMDPTIEIRDPNGIVIVDGVVDGATCNDSCSFSVDLSPTLSGMYSLLIYDRTTNEIGGYELSLWCLAGQCDGAPDPSGPAISYVTPIADAISPAVDGDFFTFNATVGTDIRLNVLAASNYLDPTVEIRDPNGIVVVDGVVDGATCNDSCSFSLDLSPALSGTYSLVIYDRTINDIGGYELSLWCLWGDCDSDADGIPDGDTPVSVDTPAVLAYGTPSMDAIDPAVDGDTYIFGGTAGDLIQINVLAAANYMDPTVEIRDPNGIVIVNGVIDGATCNDNCSYTLELSLTLSGKYSLLIYDRTTNESGSYEVGLQCLIGTCADALAICEDNCTDAPNGPLIPDEGGYIQLDTDGDGYGNLCDGDLDNDGDTNTLDLNLYKLAHRTCIGSIDYNEDADFNGDDCINTLDLNIYKGLHRKLPGPSCLTAP